MGILSEDEKADFWATMRRELPNSFRFAGSKGYVVESIDFIKSHIKTCADHVAHDQIGTLSP